MDSELQFNYKLNYATQMKFVSVFGLIFLVKKDIKYASFDGDGQVVFFSKKPYKINKEIRDIVWRVDGTNSYKDCTHIRGRVETMDSTGIVYNNLLHEVSSLVVEPVTDLDIFTLSMEYQRLLNEQVFTQ